MTKIDEKTLEELTNKFRIIERLLLESETHLNQKKIKSALNLATESKVYLEKLIKQLESSY